MYCRLCMQAALFAALVGCASSPPHTGYYLTPEELEQVYGTYALSNGDTLRITREHRRYWAEMQRTGRVEIVPVASLVFAEKAGWLRYTFKQGAFDTEVRIEETAPAPAFPAVPGSAFDP